MSETTMMQPVDGESQAPEHNSKLLYAVGGLGLVAVALGGTALGLAISAHTFASNANTTAVSSINNLQGQVSNLSQQKIPQMGICFSYTWQTDADGSTYVTGVNVTAPTSTNGVLSCSSGSFISLTPAN